MGTILKTKFFRSMTAAGSFEEVRKSTAPWSACELGVSPGWTLPVIMTTLFSLLNLLAVDLLAVRGKREACPTLSSSQSAESKEEMVRRSTLLPW